VRQLVINNKSLRKNYEHTFFPHGLITRTATTVDLNSGGLMHTHRFSATTHLSIPMDDCLMDEEFDLFEITQPSDRESAVGKDMLLCDDNGWDEIAD
jgi:hypothetical protein